LDVDGRRVLLRADLNVPLRPRRDGTPVRVADDARDRAAGGACVITADHGNAEQMLEPDGSTSTAHSLNPVPLIVTTRDLSLAGQES
jgi:hypothetical protein